MCRTPMPYGLTAMLAAALGALAAAVPTSSSSLVTAPTPQQRQKRFDALLAEAFVDFDLSAVRRNLGEESPSDVEESVDEPALAPYRALLAGYFQVAEVLRTRGCSAASTELDSLIRRESSREAAIRAQFHWLAWEISFQEYEHSSAADDEHRTLDVRVAYTWTAETLGRLKDAAAQEACEALERNLVRKDRTEWKRVVLNHAARALSAKRYEKARVLYRRVLACRDVSPNERRAACYGAGSAAAESGRYGEAIDYYRWYLYDVLQSPESQRFRGIHGSMHGVATLLRECYARLGNDCCAHRWAVLARDGFVFCCECMSCIERTRTRDALRAAYLGLKDDPTDSTLLEALNCRDLRNRVGGQVAVELVRRGDALGLARLIARHRKQIDVEYPPRGTRKSDGRREVNSPEKVEFMRRTMLSAAAEKQSALQSLMELLVEARTDYPRLWRRLTASGRTPYTRHVDSRSPEESRRYDHEAWYVRQLVLVMLSRPQQLSVFLQELRARPRTPFEDTWFVNLSVRGNMPYARDLWEERRSTVGVSTPQWYDLMTVKSPLLPANADPRETLSFAERRYPIESEFGD